MTRAIIISTCWQCQYRRNGKYNGKWTQVCSIVKDEEGKNRAIPNAKRGIPDWCTLPTVKIVEVA